MSLVSGKPQKTAIRVSAAYLNQDSRTLLIAADHPRFDGSRASDIKPGTATGLLTFNRTGSSADLDR
jgi:hypothetical protein